MNMNRFKDFNIDSYLDEAADGPELDEDLDLDEDFDPEDDGQPSEYTEWQDYMGGDDAFEHDTGEY
jgi:hypothetical protein